MASTPTITELAARVAELEARDARAAALARGARAVDLATVDLETPTRTVYEVRSGLTGAVVGTHDLETDAQREVDRLNDECRREGIKQRGEAMRYELGVVHRPDGKAEVEQRVEALDAAASKSKDAAEVEALTGAAENLRAALTEGDDA